MNNNVGLYMTQYRWNLDEIKNSIDSYEKRKLVFALMTYCEILEMNGTIRYTGIYNAIEKLTKYKFSLKRQEKTMRL